MRDAASLAPPAPAGPDVYIGGSWGVATVPLFLPWAAPGGGGSGSGLPGAYALDTGRNPGCDVGDTLVLVFDNAPRQVEVDTRASIDAVFNMSGVLGADYSGAWVQTGAYANSMLVITVLAAAGDDDDAGGRGVGQLSIAVLGAAGLTSLDGSTPASTDATLLAWGSWGDVGALSLEVASHVRARVAVAYAAGFVTAVTVACALDESYARLTYSTRVAVAPRAPGDGGGAVVVYATGTPSQGTIYCRAVLQEDYPGSSLAPYAGPAVRGSLPLRLPVLLGVASSSGQLLSTAGGEGLLLAGSYLGFADSGAVVSATYWRGGVVYRAAACGVVAMGGDGGAPMVACSSVEGAGAGFVWTVTIDGGSSAPVPSPLAYSPPVILDVSPAGNASGVMVISGRDFGPAGAAHITRVWLSRASDPNVQVCCVLLRV